MFPRRSQWAAAYYLRLALAASICLQTFAPPLMAQRPDLNFKISGPGQQLEMVVNSSRILDMDVRVPRVLVENPEVLKANPISPTQIQLAAKKPGATHLTIWDENNKVHSLDIVVIPDARELQYVLKSQFPEAALKIRPLASSVAISGYCPSAAMVSNVIAIAQDYYPNNIEIGGAQQVNLHVKVMEVSRTKLRTLGVDWALFANGVDVASKPSGLILNETIGTGAVTAAGSSLSYGVVRGATSFFTYLEALRRNNLLKVLSEPTLTTVSGRAASFNVGGEFPILVPQSLGTVSIEYRQFGTRVDFVPIVRGNGEIRLEVRPQVSEIDASRSVTVQNATIPGLRSRWVDTAAEMRAGQTLALAGLLQNRIESETRSVPVLGDLPVVGGAFRRVEESNNEVELLILVTPELVEPMDKHEVPPCGPGQFTRSPSDPELYNHGWLEVPKCCGNCGNARCKGGCVKGGHGQPTHFQVQAGQAHPGHAQPAQAGAGPVVGTGVPSALPPATPNVISTPYGEAQPPAPVVTPGQYRPEEAVPLPNDSLGQTTQANPNVAPVIVPSDIPSIGAQPRAHNAGYRPASGRSGRPGLIGPTGYDAIR